MNQMKTRTHLWTKLLHLVTPVALWLQNLNSAQLLLFTYASLNVTTRKEHYHIFETLAHVFYCTLSLFLHLFSCFVSVNCLINQSSRGRCVTVELCQPDFFCFYILVLNKRISPNVEKQFRKDFYQSSNTCISMWWQYRLLCGYIYTAS